MAKIGLPKGSGKWLKVREKSVKSQGILKWILSGNPASSGGRQLGQHGVRIAIVPILKILSNISKNHTMG